MPKKQGDQSLRRMGPVKCPICGKKFMPAQFHVYKHVDGRYICSWNCLCKNKKSKTSPKARAKFPVEVKIKAARMVVVDKIPIKDVATEICANRETIRYWVRKYEEGEFDEYMEGNVT